MRFFRISVLLIFIISLVGCSSPISTGYKNFNLLDTYETISATVKTLERAPDKSTNIRGNSLKEYYSTSEPSIVEDGLKMNPSSFFIFNKGNELVSMRLWYVCEVNKNDFDLEKTINILDKKAIKGIADLLKKENYSDKSSVYVKTLKVDMVSQLPIVKYEIRIN